MSDAIQALIDEVPGIAAGDNVSFHSIMRAQAQHAANLVAVAELRSALEGRAAEVEQLRSELAKYNKRLNEFAWRVVANAGRLSSKRMARWAHVVDATGLGSTSSRELCKATRFDPDEEVGMDQEDEEDE